MNCGVKVILYFNYRVDCKLIHYLYSLFQRARSRLPVEAANPGLSVGLAQGMGADGATLVALEICSGNPCLRDLGKKPESSEIIS